MSMSFCSALLLLCSLMTCIHTVAILPSYTNGSDWGTQADTTGKIFGGKYDPAGTQHIACKALPDTQRYLLDVMDAAQLFASMMEQNWFEEVAVPFIGGEFRDSRFPRLFAKFSITSRSALAKSKFEAHIPGFIAIAVMKDLLSRTRVDTKRWNVARSQCFLTSGSTRSVFGGFEILTPSTDTEVAANHTPNFSMALLIPKNGSHGYEVPQLNKSTIEIPPNYSPWIRRDQVHHVIEIGNRIGTRAFLTLILNGLVDFVLKQKPERQVNKEYQVGKIMDIATFDGYILSVNFLKLSQNKIALQYNDVLTALKSLVDDQSRLRDERREFRLEVYFVESDGARSEEAFMEIGLAHAPVTSGTLKTNDTLPDSSNKSDTDDTLTQSQGSDIRGHGNGVVQTY